MTGKLEIKQAFDLAVSLEMGQVFRWRRVGDESVRNGDWGEPPPLWQKDGGAWYSGVLNEHLIHIRQVNDGVEYRVGGPDGERTDVDLTEALSRYFRLDDPFNRIHAALQETPVVADAVRQYPGMRLLRQDHWECLVSYLCSNTNSIPRIQQCVEKTAGLSPHVVRLDNEARPVFRAHRNSPPRVGTRLRICNWDSTGRATSSHWPGRWTVIPICWICWPAMRWPAPTRYANLTAAEVSAPKLAAVLP